MLQLLGICINNFLFSTLPFSHDFYKFETIGQQFTWAMIPTKIITSKTWNAP